MKNTIGITGMALALAISAGVQGPGGPPPPPAQQTPGQAPAAPQDGPPPGRMGRGFDTAPPAPRASRPPLERALQPGPGGRWWDNPEMAQKLSLNSDQQKKMDRISSPSGSLLRTRNRLILNCR
jgi:hypothetical protein